MSDDEEPRIARRAWYWYGQASIVALLLFIATVYYFIFKWAFDIGILW